MSVPNWLNDATQFPNGENGTFNPTVDPSMAFMQNSSAMSFDPNQLQYSQMQPRMPASNVSNGSPAPQTPMYPTQQVVPSKRSRPQEDGMSASPNQYPGTLPTARSQTPQGTFGGYSGMTNGQQSYPGPNAYQPYPQAATNSSQSPVMQNPPFSTPAPNPQTMSPSPFSPAMQNFGAQHSPPHSDHGSRVNTPQGGAHPYAQGLTYGVPSTQSMPPSNNSAINGPGPPLYNQQAMTQQQYQQEQQRRAHEARVRQMQQMNSMGIPQRQPGTMGNPMAPYANQMQNMQMGQMRPQQVQPQQHQRTASSDQMLRSIIAFMQQRGLPFNPQPVIAGRLMNGAHIFMAGLKLQGSRRISAHNLWPKLAQMLQFAPAQGQSAAHEIASYWGSHLAHWEYHWMQQQQQQQRQRVAMETMKSANSGQAPEAAGKQGSFSPARPPPAQQGQRVPQPAANLQNQAQIPQKGSANQQFDPRSALQNGQMVQPQPQLQARQMNGYALPPTAAQPAVRPNESKPLGPPETSKVNGAPFGNKKRSTQADQVARRELRQYLVPLIHDFDEVDDLEARQVEGKGLESLRQRPFGGQKQEAPSDHQTRPGHHGGISITDHAFLDTLDDLHKYRRSTPMTIELNMNDIQNLTLALRSGIDGEIRYALDTIASLSREIDGQEWIIEELPEAVVECANDQIDVLAGSWMENNGPFSFQFYQELLRNCKMNSLSLHHIPSRSTEDLDRERASNRLICITSIFRNISLGAPYARHLVDAQVPELILDILRYQGSRKNFLKTDDDNLDFSKDAVMLLTSLSPHINFRSKDDALCILQFLLSFAPQPTPISQAQDVSFPPYVPTLHPYLPDAVEILANVLALESTRSSMKALLSADSASSSPADLLSRTFGLAIAPLPEEFGPDLELLGVSRLTCIAQGLLSAEKLLDMIPASKRSLVLRWLDSEDGFALRLKSMMGYLSVPESAKSDPFDVSEEDVMRGRFNPDGSGLDISKAIRGIYTHGLGLLRRLISRSAQLDTTKSSSLRNILPHENKILLALNSIDAVPSIVSQLCALAGTESRS